MDVVERFAFLVTCPPADVVLDEAALLISVRARGEAAVDVDGALARLDALAAGCREVTAGAPTFDDLRRFLFEREGYRGNTVDYEDPDNSFLDRVLDRRLGIPITLSVVMIEVGRRVDVGVVGIGLPGHFIVRDGDADVYCDPFGGGRSLDTRGCAALFAGVTRGRANFDRSLLAPVTPQQVLARMLTNLEHGPFAADPLRLGALLDLHIAIPNLGAADRVALADRLANVGRYREAASIVEAGAESAPHATALRQQARSFRARFN
jgi:Transglutaminase-like superfamily